MKLVYKKDGFINKLFACLFIAMFFVMCIIGNNVFASGSFDNFDTTFPIGDCFDDYYCVFLVSKSSDGYYHHEYKYSDEPITAKKISDSEYILYFTGNYSGNSSNSQSLNINFFNRASLNPPSVTNSSASIGDSNFNQSIVFSVNKDVLDYDDNSIVVFQGAPQPTVLAGVVEQQEMKPLEEILTLLPIVMIVVVSFLALRKALATLFNFLRTS